jgi:hypothetical protein
LNPDGLVYSTYLGGSRADLANHIAVDASGNAYVTGTTASLNFPTTAGAFQVNNAGITDAFVTKLNADGSGLVYSTYIGGTGVDAGTRIVLGHSGEVYVAGNAGIDFPTTPGAFQTVIGGAPDGFVTKLNPTGSALVYSTYLGGRGEEQSLGIALNTAGNAFVAGRTRSDDFPTTKKAYQPEYGGGEADAFVAKLNRKGSRLVYSTYLGGSAYDDNFGGLAVDGGGNVYLTGETRSDDFPTKRAFQDTYGGTYPLPPPVGDAYVAKLNARGKKLVFSTYLGGSGGEFANAIALDRFENVYVAGRTNSTDFPVVDSLQPYVGDPFFDAFVAKITNHDRDDDEDDDDDGDHDNDHNKD